VRYLDILDAILILLSAPQQPEPIMFQPSQQTLPPSPPSDTHQTQPNPADMTYATAYSSSHDDMPPSKPAPPAKRVVSNTAPSAAAKKAALAAKKKREVCTTKCEIPGVALMMIVIGADWVVY
jgi:hypothetical protein